MNNNVLVGPPYKSPILEQTLGQFFFESCEKYADRICQIDATTGEKETYGSVKQRSVRVALELQSRGITSEHVVAFCSVNTIDTIIPILGTYYLGAKVANLEPTLSVKQVQHLVSLVEPKIIFAQDDSYNLIEQAAADLNCKPEIITYSALRELTKEKANEEFFKPISVDHQETALFLFTSGTSGLPKAICHTHSSFLHAAYGTHGIGWDHPVYHGSRFYWITAHIMLQCAFMSGSYRVFTQALDVESIIEALHRYKVHTAFLSTSMVPSLVSFQKINQYDFSALKNICLAGHGVSAVLLDKLTTIFKNTNILFSFGMSEGAFLTFNPQTDQHLMKTKVNSCGKPFYGLSVKVVDIETENKLGPNEKGEIRFKGKMLFKSYYKMDSSDAFDKEGFLKTGDVGYYDEDNCIYVVERIKEMFKFRGWHIVPTFLEGILLEHAAVQEAVVFGLPGYEEGDAPAAAVIIKKGFTATEEELQKFVADKVPEKERLIGGITFVETLPKTPTGKVLRREVKETILKKVQP